MGFPMTVQRVLSRNRIDPASTLAHDIRRLAEDAVTLAGGSLTATEPPLDGSGYYGEHTYQAGSPRGVTPALDVERLEQVAESLKVELHYVGPGDDADAEEWATFVAEYARLGSPTSASDQEAEA